MIIPYLYLRVPLRSIALFRRRPTSTSTPHRNIRAMQPLQPILASFHSCRSVARHVPGTLRVGAGIHMVQHRVPDCNA